MIQCEQQGLETHTIKCIVIEYNVPVKDHHVSDDCIIESSNDH